MLVANLLATKEVVRDYALLITLCHVKQGY